MPSYELPNEESFTIRINQANRNLLYKVHMTHMYELKQNI